MKTIFILASGWVLIMCKLLSLHLVSQANIMLFSYRQGCSCRTDSADRMRPCSSFPGISRSSAHLCCLCSSCSDLRDPWHDTAPHRSNIRHSCRYSYRLKERHTPTVRTYDVKTPRGRFQFSLWRRHHIYTCDKCSKSGVMKLMQ